MGSLLCKRWSTVESRILLVGLDASGKTTILYRLKLGEVVTTIPTIGFNVETLNYKKVTFSAWDVGGRGKLRALIRHYFVNTDAILYVVDSNDVERFDEAKEELHSMLVEEELRDSILLVLANKQDLNSATSPMMISESLELHTVKQNHHIIPTVATSGEGLSEALEWLYQAILQKKGVINDFIKKDEDSEKECRIASKNISSVGSHWSKVWEIFRTMFIASSTD